MSSSPSTTESIDIAPACPHLPPDVLAQLQGPDYQKVIDALHIPTIRADVFIAGSGPIAATYARTVLGSSTKHTVVMAEIGSQDGAVTGRHHKNSLKYQNDLNAFTHVVQGALQTISVPSIQSDLFNSTLIGNAWRPHEDAGIVSKQKTLIFQGQNPDQDPTKNLGAAAVTRTVGGMGTHWTCCCPTPHEDELRQNPIANANKAEFDNLLRDAKDILHVNTTTFDKSVRHTVIKETLKNRLPDRDIQNLPLAVQARTDNKRYLTWSGVDTVLGGFDKEVRFTLKTEHRVTRLIRILTEPWNIRCCVVRDANNDRDVLVFARAFVIACGAICTPQILHNSYSGLGGPALGRWLCEHSLAFCQVVLNREIVQAMRSHPSSDIQAAVKEHSNSYPKDPLPIPFTDWDPQIYLPFSPAHPHHGQVHRDAFSYGDVAPAVDGRVIVDLRFFGRQETNEKNMVTFAKVQPLPVPLPWSPSKPYATIGGQWKPAVTDIQGMPQATFSVTRSENDSKHDQIMMDDMTNIAHQLGAYLPGANPQFMEPGLAQHITGTTRIGTDSTTSVADPDSKVHGTNNLWVGGNGNIPDSMASNPTLTSMAIALKSARSIVKFLARPSSSQP